MACVRRWMNEVWRTINLDPTNQNILVPTMGPEEAKENLMVTTRNMGLIGETRPPIVDLGSCRGKFRRCKEYMRLR